VPLPARDRAARRLAPSLVTVDARIPYRIEGAHGGNFRGTGLIVDADRGWVLVDRDTVPVTLADVTLTFGGVAELPAEVVWLHPAHNLGVVRYDPALLVDSPFRAARLAAAPPDDGARVWHVGLDRSDQVVSKRTRVDRANPVSIGLPRSPTFRDTNLDVLDPESAAESTGGALADRRGRVVALWASFVDLSGEEADAWFRGLPVDVVAEALDALRAGAADPWPTPGLELGAVDLSTARDLGLSEARAAALTAADPVRRQALGVERLRHGSPAAERLKIGDLLLSVDGAPLTRARQLELALRGDGVAALEVLRDGVELPVELPATPAPAAEIDRALLWGGALLHATPQWAPAQRGAPAVGAYVAWVWSGSPASRDGLRGTFRVVAVGDREVATLDDFARAVQGLTGDVRLRALDLEGRPQVLTLKLDAEAWPAAELIRGPGGWRRVDPAR
jgi:S1-C subfamily serine protease